jgi:AsmA protein
VAIEGGQLDSRVINAWLARLQPLRIEGGDVTELRCLAVRADAKAGVVTVQPIALNTAALILDGGGEVELGPETLSLRVRPRTRIGGTGIAVPVRVSGPMGAPSARVDISPGGGGLAGLLLGGKDIMGAAGGGDPCPAALARARGGTADELPPAAGGAK